MTMISSSDMGFLRFNYWSDGGLDETPLTKGSLGNGAGRPNNSAVHLSKRAMAAMIRRNSEKGRKNFSTHLAGSPSGA